MLDVKEPPPVPPLTKEEKDTPWFLQRTTLAGAASAIILAAANFQPLADALRAVLPPAYLPWLTLFGSFLGFLAVLLARNATTNAYESAQADAKALRAELSTVKALAGDAKDQAAAVTHVANQLVAGQPVRGVPGERMRG